MLDPTKKKIPHVQGQKRSPSKMVGGAKLHLESNPIPAWDTWRLKHTLCTSGPRGPTETEQDMCVSVSCGGAGQQWPAAKAGALGAADLGMAQARLEEVAINPTIEPPEFTPD